MCTQKMRALSFIGARFPLNLTDRHTYRQTDISVYRVASLLKNKGPKEPPQKLSYLKSLKILKPPGTDSM